MNKGMNYCNKTAMALSAIGLLLLWVSTGVPMGTFSLYIMILVSLVFYMFLVVVCAIISWLTDRILGHNRGK